MSGLRYNGEDCLAVLRLRLPVQSMDYHNLIGVKIGKASVFYLQKHCPRKYTKSSEGPDTYAYSAQTGQMHQSNLYSWPSESDQLVTDVTDFIDYIIKDYERAN